MVFLFQHATTAQCALTRNSLRVCLPDRLCRHVYHHTIWGSFLVSGPTAIVLGTARSARRIVLLLRGTNEFKEMGGQAVRGLLRTGDPGTGKSYLAQCMSTEAGVPFAYASAASFQ